MDKSGLNSDNDFDTYDKILVRPESVRGDRRNGKILLPESDSLCQVYKTRISAKSVIFITRADIPQK